MKPRERKKLRILRRAKNRYAITELAIARILGVKVRTAHGYARELVKEGKLFTRYVLDGTTYYGVTEESE